MPIPCNEIIFVSGSLNKAPKSLLINPLIISVIAPLLNVFFTLLCCESFKKLYNYKNSYLQTVKNMLLYIKKLYLKKGAPYAK